MVRVIHKRIIAFLLCVALTFGAVSATKPTEAKAFVLDFLSAEALQALIAALQAAAGQAMDAATEIASSSDALADTSNMLIAAENFVYYIMANRIIPLVDDAGQRFAGYVTSNFVFENSVSYDNVDDYFRAMDPSKTQEVINDPEFICAVPYDPSQLYYLSPAVVENTQTKLKERGTSLMEIMQRLRDCGVTTYQNFVSALKDILKDTATVLVNDQTKAMFNAILQVTSNAAREVVRANVSTEKKYNELNNLIEIFGKNVKYRSVFERYFETYPDSRPQLLFLFSISALTDTEIQLGTYRYGLAVIDPAINVNSVKNVDGKLKVNGNSRNLFAGYYYINNDELIYRENTLDPYIVSDCGQQIYYLFINNGVCEIDDSLDVNLIGGEPLHVISGTYNYSDVLTPMEEAAKTYKGLPNPDVLENAGSLDALVERAAAEDDPVAWINPNAQVADAAADAAEAEALASQVTLINQGIDKSNSWLESIFNSIQGMATTVTNIFDVLSTGLSKMLTGAADRVVEGFQDIFIDDVGDNVLERACTGIDNLVAGVGDLAGLKEAVEAIEAATGEQVKLLTAEDAVAAELKTQFGGADLNGLFKLVYLLLYILIKLLFLFLRCLSLIVVVFKVPATTGFLPDGMIQGLNWIKAFEIPNFNINLWDFMFLLIYIVLTFRVIGAIKHHIDKISV